MRIYTYTHVYTHTHKHTTHNYAQALATSLREAEVSSTNANTKDLHTHITSWIDSVQAIRTALQLLTNISVNDEEADQDNSGSNHNKSSNDNLWQTLMVQQNILPQVLSHCQNYTTPSSSPSSSSSSSPATEWIAYVEKASGEISKLLSTKSKNSDNDSNSSNSNTNADGSQTITNANGEKVQIITVNGGSKGEDDNKIDFSLSSYLALLNSINVDATSCLNNMVLSFPLSLLGDTEGLFMRMSLLCDTIVNSANGSVGDEGNHQKLVCSLGLMHSILRKNPAIVLGDDQLQLLKSILTSSSSSTLSEAHLNIIGILGILGVNSQHFKDNALIGGALVHVLMQGMTEQKNSTAHTPVMYVASFHRGEIAAECLNAVFDVYSADNTHTQVIQQLQLLQVLHQAESFFSGQFENLCEFHDQLKGMDTMYKETSNKDDQKNGDSGNSTNSSEKASVLAMMMSEMNEMKREMILMRLDETLENLRNFLEYKPDHV